MPRKKRPPSKDPRVEELRSLIKNENAPYDLRMRARLELGRLGKVGAQKKKERKLLADAEALKRLLKKPAVILDAYRHEQQLIHGIPEHDL